MTQRITLLFLLLCMVCKTFAQADPPPPDKAVPAPETSATDRQPSFPGGDMALKKFLEDNLTYPPALKEAKIQGWVTANFIVEKDGSITNVEVVKDIGGGSKQEVKDLISRMPNWEPGIANGSPVRTRMTLPVQFKLESEQEAKRPKSRDASIIVQPMDLNTVWEAVRIKIAEIYQEKDVTPDFKIKSDKDSRLDLVHALEGQFQVNIGENEIKSLKKAEDLRDYIFEAQDGLVMYSKVNFMGKVERLSSKRKDCKTEFDCLNFVGSVFVPQGMVVTFYSDKKFKGDYLRIDARNQKVEIPSFFNIKFEGPVSSKNPGYNWREGIHSIKVDIGKK